MNLRNKMWNYEAKLNILKDLEILTKMKYKVSSCGGLGIS